MNDLTSTLLASNFQHDIEEFAKQGIIFQYGDGKQQRITGTSIPSLTVQIGYNNIGEATFKNLKSVYERNHSNTFKVDFGADTDMRGSLMTTASSTFAFKSFEFSELARSKGLFSGKIELLSSLFFDFPKYQDLFTESSSYNRARSFDDSFNQLIEQFASPYLIEYSYNSVNIFSRIGNSVQFEKDKLSLKRTTGLSFLLKEVNFLKLLTYYRKKSGIMGEFGLRDFVYSEANYKSRFKQDSLQYTRSVNGLYSVKIEIEDVL